jgi:hypothetical protein
MREKVCSSALIIHHAVLRTFDVIELSGLGRPDEGEPCGKADEEHENDECDDGPEHVCCMYSILPSPQSSPTRGEDV